MKKNFLDKTGKHVIRTFAWFAAFDGFGITKLVYDSDDEEEVDDEEVDVVDRKSLVDMLLDCWKRKGVKEADLIEIMTHCTVLLRQYAVVIQYSASIMGEARL